jgi:hypothetical protein
MFAHLAPFGACKSLLGKHLLKRSRAKRGFKIRPQRTIGELLESFLDHANKKCSIGVPLVTTAIAAFALCMKAVDRVMLGKHSCMFKVQKQMVALLVNIGGDVMSDLAGRVAQAHALVVRGRSNPNRPALVANFFNSPEANMIPLPRVVADRLLKRQIFFATEEKEITDGSINVRPRKHCVFRDCEIAANSQCGRRIPFGRMHDRFHLLLRADEGHIERITRMIIACLRNPRIVVERRMMVRVSFPRQWNDDIRANQVNSRNAE